MLFNTYLELSWLLSSFSRIGDNSTGFEIRVGAFPILSNSGEWAWNGPEFQKHLEAALRIAQWVLDTLRNAKPDAIVAGLRHRKIAEMGKAGPPHADGVEEVFEPYNAEDFRSAADEDSVARDQTATVLATASGDTTAPETPADDESDEASTIEWDLPEE